MYSMDLGMDTSKLLVMRLALPERKYPALEQRLAFYQQIEERLKANPRIEAVTIASNMPMQGGFMRRLTLDGKPLEQGQQAPEVTMLTIDPRYFDTVGLPLIRGRGLTDEDGMTGRESAVINQQFAQAALSQRGSDRPPDCPQHGSAGRRGADQRHSRRR